MILKDNYAVFENGCCSKYELQVVLADSKKRLKEKFGEVFPGKNYFLSQCYKEDSFTGLVQWDVVCEILPDAGWMN